MSPKITVVGVGGAGGNAVNNMITSNLEGVEFVICNTDAQAIEGSLCETRIQLGVTVTGGLGAGARPEIGRAAAEESLEEVMQYMDGSNMVFITAGMGGGTGTGAAPVIARACRERGILTVGVVTKPFHFEGSLRMKMAEEGIRQMQEFVDTLIVIPNQNLFRVANEKTTFAEAFKMADSVLQAGVRGVTDLMVMPALINLDFADIRTAMMEMGKAMMGMGEGIGDKRAIDAAEAAINNPLLDDVSMKGARGVIINVTGGGDMTLFEVDEACNRIREEVDPNANIIFGATFDEKMEGVMRVSIVATGIDVAETQKRSTSGAMSNSMLNVMTSAQQQERKLDRSRPNAASVDVAQQVPAAQPVSRPVSASPTYTQNQVVRQKVSHAPAVHAATASARRMEEEPEMFEQGEFVSESAPVQSYVQSQPAIGTFHAQTQTQAQTQAQRGMRYNDAFIPPAAIEVQAPRVMEQVPVHVPQQPVQTSQSSFTLRPPTPVTTTTSARKRGQSLFERFTQGLRHEESEDEGGTDTGNAGGNAGGGLRATSRQHNSYQPAPQQGSLDIEAPVATRPGPQVEDELDIPAFLRRQAN